MTAAESSRRTWCARNMFPCSGEVSLCDAYSAFLDSRRDSGNARVLEAVHMERTWLECGVERGSSELSISNAVLFTMRGRMELRVPT